MFERFRSKARSGSDVRARVGVMPVPAIRALEPRFIFDGAAAPAAAQAHSDAAAQSHGDQTETAADSSHAETADSHPAAPAAAAPGTETASSNGRHEIVVIDKGVADLQTLLAGVPASAEVILIDSNSDGFDQLAKALEGRSDIDAIHILSHGTAGDLHLGTGELTAESIQVRYAADLAIIGRALTATGDLLIYGCDFAAGDVGARATELLAAATGADVAASDDATGDMALGGDWDLEVHDGSIETGVVVSDAAQREYHHLLATASIHVSGDPVVKDGSGNTISATRASNGINYLDVSANVVGATAFWTNAGTVDGVNVSLRATVISTGEADDAVSFGTSSGGGGDASVLIRSTTATTGAANQAASITIRWDLVRADDPSVAVVADVDFQIGDIDGIGGQPNTRESVTPSQTGLTSYALATTTDLVVDSSNNRIRVSGTQDETASPPDSVSIVRFDWTNVSSWQVTYDLAANANTGQAAFQHDGDRGLTFNAGAVKTVPKVDLDGNDSSGATGNDYRTSFTEKGSAVAITDTDPLVTNAAATVSSATVVLTNAQAGDRLNVGSLPSGITAMTTSTSGTITVTLTGDADPATYQAALQAITFDNTRSDPSTADRIVKSHVTSDGVQGTDATTTVSVVAVNDAPVNSVPTARTLNEDGSLIFSSGNGTAITVSDVDAGSSNLTTTLSVLHGVLSLGSTSGVTVNGNGTGTISLTGTVSAVNAALNGTTYAPLADYNGGDTLTVVTNDNGNTGTGGAKSDTDTIGITVTPVNDAPVLDLDASGAGTGYATSYTEDGAGIAIVDTDVSVTDVDNANIGSAKAAITNGGAGDALSISGTLPTGITASYDAGTYTLTLTGSATKAAYQTALQQIRYSSTNPDPSTATRTIAVTVNDGALDSNTAVTSVTFTAVNDAPVNAVPAAQTVDEDTSLVFSAGNANAITVSDPDAGTGNLTTTISVQHGTLTLGSTSGVTVSNDGTGSVTLTGTAAAIDTALDGTAYRPSAGYNGSDTLSVVTNDNGNTGSGGAKSDTDALSITVTPVNDAPVNGLPAAQSVDEDTNLVFSTGNGNAVTVSDVDAGSGSLITTLSVLHGTLTLGGTANVTVSGSGTSSVTLSGTVADINAALNGTIYRGDPNYNGADTLAMTTDDGGNTGAGGAKSDSDTLAITVRPVNDSPMNGAPAATQIFDEDTALVFSAANGNGVSVADLDGGGLTVTLSSAQGLLTLSKTDGLTLLQGDGAADGTMRFSGSIADINAALEGLRFDPGADVNGAAQITLATTDPEGATASSTIALSITPVADIVPDTVATDEDTGVTFNALTGTNGASADTFESPAASVSSVTQGGHGSVSFQADGTLTYTPEADFNGTDSFTYTVTSGGSTETASVTVTVRPVNDAPVLDLSASAAGTGYATNYTERAPGVAIVDADVSLTDIDSASMASAKAVITNGSTGDTLGIGGTLPPGITATFDPATYTLTLTGSASKADYQTALLQIRFSSAERDPATDTRSIDVSVNDGALDSAIATTTIVFTAVNDAPVNGLPADQSFAEDGALVFSPGAGSGITVSDADAHGGDIATTIGVQHGTLTLGSTTGVTVIDDGTGSVTLTGSVAAINAALDGTTYRPDADYNGADTLTIVTNDNGNTGTGGAQSDTDTLALAIAAVNDAPRAGTLPAIGSLDGDTVPAADLGRYFSDIEGDTLRFSAGGLPAGLTIDPATGLVSGTIDRSASQGGASGDYTVTITADDGQGGLTNRSFTWRVVDPVPIARNDGAITDAASPLAGSVLTNNGNGADSDPDGDPLSVAAVNGAAAGLGQPVAGSAGGRFTVLADGSYRFDPGSDFTDLASGQTRTTRIIYTVSDGEGGLASAILAVTVTGRNDAPAPLSPGDRAASDGDRVALPLGILFPDPDGEVLRYSASGLPPGLAIDPTTGAVTGTIDHAASGPNGLADYAVTITATDPQGQAATRGFTFRVTNPAPQATDDAVTTAEDMPVLVDVLANNSDSDGDGIAIIATGDAAPSAGHGQVAVVNGRLSYTPDANFNGTDTITYAIVDENGGTSTASVTVTVTPVENAPDAGTLPNQSGRDGAPVSYDISSRFRDPDTDPSVVKAPSGDSLSYTATGLPPGLSIDPTTGLISGTLPSDASPVSRYTVTVTATDAAGASVARSFTWTVSTDAPIATPDTATTRENTAVLVTVTANDIDPDGDAIRLVGEPGATSAAHGTVSVDPATGLLTYTPDNGFSGRDTIVYTIEDAQGVRATGILTVTVTPVNERPVAPETLPGRTAADGDSVRVPLGNLIVDPDGDALAYSVTGLPPGLTIDPATGEIAGTIDHAASGPSGRKTYVVTLTATDPGGLTVSRSFAWTVTNPAPTASDEAITTPEDTAVDIDVTTNDTDPDGDPLSVVPGSAIAGHGTVTLNPDGSLHYTPERDFNGTDHIVYTITDGNGGFATASVAITVTPVNDAPTFDPASPALADRSANDAQAVSIPAGSAFRDVDAGDRLSFAATGLPPGLSIDSDTGLISGTIASDASTRVPGGVYTITLTGTDLAGASATTRLTITVANPAPIAVDDAATLAEDAVLTGSVLGNDSDPDGDAIQVDPVPVAGPAHGRLDLRPDGTFTYAPDADFHGEDSFTYALVDSDGGRSTATVHLTIASLNDAPTASADPVTTREDTPVDGRILANDKDGDPLTYTAETLPSSGRLTLRPDGSFTYTPGADFNGNDSFTVRVSDGQGGSVLVTVPVAIAAVDDAPEGHADPLVLPANTVGTGQVVATDLDGDPVTFRLAGNPANGSVVLAADGSYAYKPYAAFSGADSFTVEVSDGNGGITLVTVEISVTPNPVQVPPSALVPILAPLPFSDRPAAPPVLPPASAIAANGFILPALAEIDALGSVGDVILADGAVVAAVNGVASLHGTTIILDHPVLLDESDRIARVSWERFEHEPIADTPWFSPRPYLGRSLGVSLSADEAGLGTSDLMLEAIRRPDSLAINLRNDAPGLSPVAGVRLLGIDGAPAPDWIESDGKGGFWGRPPAGTGLVKLELEIVLENGSIVRRPLSVDSETGEIRALPNTRPSADPRTEAPLFTAQLAALGARGAHDLALIERALTRGI